MLLQVTLHFCAISSKSLSSSIGGGGGGGCAYLGDFWGVCFNFILPAKRGLMKTACDGTMRKSKSPQHIQYCSPPWLNTTCTLLFYKNNTFVGPRTTKTENHSCVQLRCQSLQETLLWTFLRLHHTKCWRVPFFLRFAKSGRSGERNTDCLWALQRSGILDYLSLSKTLIKVNSSWMLLSREKSRSILALIKLKIAPAINKIQWLTHHSGVM